MSIAARLSPTTLSQYIRLDSCQRYLWYRLFPGRTQALLRGFDVTEQPLTPLLADSGERFEQSVVANLAGFGYQMIDLQAGDGDAVVQAISALAPGEPTALTQAHLSGRLGDWTCSGRADVILAELSPAGELVVTVADIKSSRQARVEHHLQVALYCRMLEERLAEAGIAHVPVAGAVLHQEEGRLPDLTGALPTFNLAPYRLAIDNLTRGDEAALNQVSRLSFEETPYHLSYKCDGCLYNAICLADSNERRELSLIPYLQPLEKRTLQAAGLDRLEQVVALKGWPAEGEAFPAVLPAGEGQGETLAALATTPVGPVIDQLVARARAVLRRFEPETATVPFLPGGRHSELPIDEDMVRVYLDAQHDYQQNCVYLLSARMVGPAGEREVVRRTPTAPEERDERRLLVAWVRDVSEAIRECAGDDWRKVHFYVFDRYDQKVLLEALRRHLDALAALPAFYDLLTQTPALTQAMVSFLADEIRQRRSSGWLNQSLVRAASSLGFDWKHEGLEFFQLFRARVFDDRRRSDAGTREVAARFNSQIPLEYAYAAWGLLPDGKDAREKHMLDPFRQVSGAQLEAFAAHRLRALAFLEEKLRPKFGRVDKAPLHLAQLGDEGGAVRDLPHALANFLLMERHADVQELMTLYGLPIAHRAQTGRALLLHCLEAPTYDNGYLGQFRIDYAAVGLHPILGRESLRLKAGSWCVLNPLTDEHGRPVMGKRLANGKLFMVQAIEDDRVTLKPMNAKKASRFVFKHWNVPVHAGGDYALDEMADDLLGDRLLEACQQAADNPLVRFAEGGGLPSPAYDRPAAESFAELVSAVTAPHVPTAMQRRIIAEAVDSPVVLVQGPPGTGKSHTLGWAVLARLLALPGERHPRVAVVCAKTHNAVNIVLESIAKKRATLRAEAPDHPATQALRDLRLYKLGEADQAPPEGVRVLSPYQDAALALELKTRDLTVIGATPGQLYNFFRYTGGVNWAARHFNLIVLDEASQMSLPEAVLASAFLKSGGQILVAGDHRQLPPILAHDWKEELRREVETFRPYRSIFDFLLAAGAPVLPLDESFRLHRLVAAFLAEHIYREDGIAFFSKRTETLPAQAYDEALVAAALHPDYPIIVIEHEERFSQRANALEAAIAAPIIAACSQVLGLDGRHGLGVVVPHTAQRALLSARFGELAAEGAIDTVDRFQGGERDVIIVSATVSDPDYALAESEFLLGVQRLNVAISRARKKLIVIAGASLFRLLPADVEIFRQASLWKLLRFGEHDALLWHGQVDGHGVKVFGRRG